MITHIVDISSSVQNTQYEASSFLVRRESDDMAHLVLKQRIGAPREDASWSLDLTNDTIPVLLQRYPLDDNTVNTFVKTSMSLVSSVLGNMMSRVCKDYKPKSANIYYGLDLAAAPPVLFFGVLVKAEVGEIF